MLISSLIDRLVTKYQFYQFLRPRATNQPLKENELPGRAIMCLSPEEREFLTKVTSKHFNHRIK